MAARTTDALGGEGFRKKRTAWARFTYPPISCGLPKRNGRSSTSASAGISDCSCQIAGTPLGSKRPVHPNDHVNMSQSSNDTFPSAMNIAAAVNAKQRLMPAVKDLRDAIAAKEREWNEIVKIGSTHMQDATPLTLSEEECRDKCCVYNDDVQGTAGIVLAGMINAARL